MFPHRCIDCLHCEPFYILSVKRSDKKNAPHFKSLEKRQEKCATFEASRKATRKWPENFIYIFFWGGGRGVVYVFLCVFLEVFFEIRIFHFL